MRELNINKQAFFGKDNPSTNKTTDFFKGIDTFKEDSFDTSAKEVEGISLDEYDGYINKGENGNINITSTSDNERAVNQSNWEQTGRAIQKFLPNVGLEILSQVGNLLDIEDYANSDNEVGNWLSNWAQDRKKDVNDHFAIYRENPGEALDVGDFAWWVENGSALVESVTAFAAVGYATGGFSLGALNNGKRALEVLKMIGQGNNAKRGTQLLATLSNAMLLNHAEGMGIATNVYKETYEKALKEAENNNLKNAEEVAKQEAARKAESALKVNKLNILLNLTSAGLFIKTPKLTRQIRNKASIQKSAKTALSEGIQEAGEETINMIAENQALKDEYNFNNIVQDVFSKEGLENALLGFVGGTGQTAMTNSGRLIKNKRDNKGNKVNSIDLQNIAYKDQQDSLERISQLSKAEKIASSSDMLMRAEEVFNLKNEILTLESEGKREEANALKDKLTANQAYDAFSNGTTEQFINIFEGLNKLTEEQAEERGLDKNTYKKKTQEAINYINNLENAYNTSENYLNQYEVYENRASDITISKALNNINTDLTNEKEIAKQDLYKLGIKEDHIKEMENGRLTVEFFSDFALKSPTFNLYNEKIETINNLKKEQERLNKDYLDLISSKTQNKIKNAINTIKVKDKKEKQKEDTLKNNRKQKTKKDKIVETTRKEAPKKQEVKVQEQQKENEEPAKEEVKNEPVQDIQEKDIDYTFKSVHPSDEVFVKGGNTILNKNIPLEEKLQRVNKAISSLESNQKKGQEGATGMLIQFNEAKRLLEDKLSENQQKENVKEVTKTELNNKFKQFAETLNSDKQSDEDLAPITDKQREQIFAKVNNLIDILNYMDENGYDTSDFKTVFDAFIESVGEKTAVSLYEDFKAVYNLTEKSKEKITKSYEDYYFTTEEKEELLKSENLKELNKFFNNFYLLSETEFNKKLKENLNNIVKKQGYKVFERENVNEDATYKVVEGHNKIAYLAKNYNTVVKPVKLGFNNFEFAISKEDVDRNVNNIDIRLLDPNMLNKGDTISFKALDEIIYDDGTIVRKDGTVIKDGIESKENPVDIAPIAMYINDELVEGSFLHTVEWLNNNNIAYASDIERQSTELRKIRENVLNNPNGLITTISNISTGWLLQDANNISDIVNNNLPKIEIAVAKDGVFFTDDINFKESSEELLDGFVYGIAPVGDKNVPIPLERASLKDYPQYIESITEAVSIYLKNDKKDQRRINLVNQIGLDLTTDKGIETYLSKFIYLYPYKQGKKSYYEFEKFKDLLNSSNENTSIIRFIDGSIQFGRGLGVGNSIGNISKNSYNNSAEKEKALENSLNKLKNVLENNTFLNVSKKDLKNKEFELPLLTKNDVSISTVDYTDFLKNHLKTSFYSVTLENGKEIYTVQRNIEYNTDLKEDKIIPVKEEIKETGSDIAGSINLHGTTYNFNLDDDLSPITLTEEEENTLNSNSPISSLVQGVPISVQNDLVNHLSSTFLKFVNEDKNIQKAFDLLQENSIDSFKNVLKVGRDFYNDAYKNTGKEAAKIRYEIANVLFNNYNKLVNLTLDRLQTINNLDVSLLKQTAKFRQYNEFLNESELEQKEQNNWEADDIFKEDIKSKMSTNIKNFFSYIPNAKFNSEGNIIPVKKFLNVNEIKSFDEVVNDLNAILAYNNVIADQIQTPSYESMLNTLENWVTFKPYLSNVISKLKEADEKTKNEFVQVMSKHYTNHVYIGKTDKGFFIGNSDNNTVVKIMQQHWLNNLYSNNLIKEVNGEFIIDSIKVDELNNQVDSLINSLKQNSPKKVEEARVVLNNLGFNFDNNILNLLINKGLKYDTVPHSLLTMFTSKSGVFNLYLNRLNEIKNKNVEDNHPFYDNSSLNKFTKELAKFQPVYFANSFKDVQGKGYFAYSQNKFLTDRIKSLKYNYKNVLNKLKEQPFSSNSEWLKELTNESSDFKNSFNYFTFDGISSKNSSKKLETVSDEELEEVKLNLLFNNVKGNKYKNFTIKTLYPTTSNKKVSYGLQFKGTDYRGKLNDKGFLVNSEKVKLFKKLLVPEINRILHLQENKGRYDIKNYEKGGLNFILFPKLNNRQGDTGILWNKDGSLRTDILANKESQIVLYKELLDYVNNLVNNRISLWEDYGFVNTIEDDSTGTILTKKHLKFTSNQYSLREEAYNYELNYLEANMNVFQMFITDPANYWKSSVWKDVKNRTDVLEQMVKEGYGETIEDIKNVLNSKSVDTRNILLPYYTENDWLQEHEDTFNNIGKRLAADAAPGIDLPDSNNNSFTLAHLADSEREVYLNEYYKTILGNNASDYLRGVNATDAQEFTTLKEHLYILNKQGKISSEEMNRLLSLEESGSDFNNLDLKTIFQPLKPVYVQNIWKEGIEHRIYVKSSSFPLFKQLTNNLELDKLRKQMLKQNIDRVAFESAVKVGGTTSPSKIYETGKENVGKIKNNFELKIIGTIPREGFKIQQEVPYNENKQYINDGTQQIKLLTANLRDIKGFKLPESDELVDGNTIQQELDKSYNELFKLNYKALQEELEYDIFNDTINVDKLSEILRKEAIQRGYSLNDIEALNTIKKNNEDTEFEIPLWLNGVAGKLEAMLNSIVDNRVRKLKPKGKSYVLGTAEGFRPILEGEKGQAFINKTKGIIWDQNWFNDNNGQLNPMVVKDKEGRLLGEKDFDKESSYVDYAEILVPFNFTDNNGNKLDLTRYTKVTEEGTFLNLDKLDKQLLNIFSFRIPTQSLSSMSAVKIVGFLPKQSGDLLIAPPDWTIQMGSDFDVDKVFTNSYNTNFKEETGKLTRYKGEDTKKILENRILDLHFSILGSTNKEVQARILKPLDFGMLKDLADELYPYTVKRIKGLGLTSDYQSFKYLNARAGKAGIGTFSTDSTFMASIQNKDIFLQEYDPINKTYTPFSITIGGNTSNLLSEVNVNTIGKKRDKLDVISAFQSLAVDDENEQGLFKLNVNNSTFGVIRSMSLLGFEEDIISYFINQPIIREYSKLFNKANSELSSIKSYEIDKLIADKYPVEEGINAEFYEKYGNISKEDLINNIKEGNITNPTQRLIYEQFKQLDQYGKNILYVQSTINTHSAGFGKDLFYSSIKEEQLLKLQSFTPVANASKLIGTYQSLKTLDAVALNYASPLEKSWHYANSNEKRKAIVEDLLKEDYINVTPITNSNGDIRKNIAFIKPTTINGFTSVYGLSFNNKLWSKYFPYNNLNIRNLIKALNEGIENRSLGSKATLNRKTFDSIKSYLNSKFFYNLTDGELIEERQRLLVDTNENSSLGTIISNLRNSNKLNNPFINRLQIDLKKNVLPSLITYKANIAENIDEKMIYSSIQSMLEDTTTSLGIFNNIEYTPRKIVQDLVTYSFINGGVQKANEFIKYLPLNYLKSLGYFNLFKDIDFDNTSEFDTSSMYIQYAQHNPSNYVLGKKDLENFNSYKKYNEGTVIVKPSGNLTNLPKIFSIVNNNAVSGYKLFKYNENTNDWRQIDTLGYKNILEYDGNISIAKSIVPSNQVPTNIKIDLPILEENNDFLNLAKNNNTSDLIKKEQTLEEYYKISDNTKSDTEKIAFILNKINNDTNNPIEKVLSSELLNNIENIADYKLIFSNKLNSNGFHSYKSKTIGINMNLNNTKDNFTKTFLEEVIHAFTKKAILDNTNGEVLRLKGLRKLAINELRNKDKNLDDKLADLINKLQNGQSISEYESNVLYPLINDTEFIGRLFKSKELQEILNNASIEETSILNKIYDFIIKALNSLGLNINQGSALEYAIVDTISLINQSPSTSVQAELNNTLQTVRTVDYVYDKYNLKNNDGTLREFDFDTGKEIVNHINTTFSNLNAVLIDNFIVIESINRYEDDLSPKVKQDIFDVKEGKVSPLIRSYNNRIKVLEKNIDKADSAKDYERSNLLTDQLNDIVEKRNEAVALTSLRDKTKENSDIYYKGKQDLEEVRQMFKNNISVEDTLYIRKILDFWLNSKNLLFSEDELKSEALVNDFNTLINEADGLKNQLIELETSFMNDFIKQYGRDISVKDIFNHYKDINGLTSKMLDISRSNNNLLDSVYMAVKEANVDALDESKVIIDKVEELESKILPILRSSGDKELYEIFRQKTKNGNLTGHIVKRYTSEFIKDFNTQKKSFEESPNANNYSNFINWSKKNLNNINLANLFPQEDITDSKKLLREEEQNRLKDLLGENHYKEFIKNQSDLINEYNSRKSAKLSNMYSKYNVKSKKELTENKEAKKEFAEWISTNSPFEFYKHLEKGLNSTEENYKGFFNTRYIEFIPKNSKSFDTQYKQIESNKDLLEFYNYYSEIDRMLRGYLPTKERRNLAYYGIPHIEKTLLDLYKDKGMKLGLAPIWDTIRKSVRSLKDTNTDTSSLDPVTNKPDVSLQVKLAKNNSLEIKDYIDKKAAQYLIDKGVKPTKEDFNIWREEIVHQLAELKSYDLSKILRVYALTALAYKHKSKIEDSIQLSQNILKEQKEVNRDASGNIIKDEKDNPTFKKKEDSFINTKNQYDYFVNLFFGTNKKEEGKTSTEVLTVEEKNKKKEYEEIIKGLDKSLLNGSITQAEYDAKIQEFQFKIDKLGGVAVNSKRGDNVLKWVQLVKMGWNAMSSVANVGFGYLANRIEANGGMLYNNENLTKAYKMMPHSIYKNLSFNKASTPTGRKIRNIMDRWDVLKDASHELFTNPFDVNLGKSFESLKPYNLTQRTEYLNQAPILIATLLSNKIKTDKGEFNLWEVLDEQGNFNEKDFGKYSEENENSLNKTIKNLRIKIDQINKMNHGNYDPISGIELKKQWWGRAISQFRTWMMEGYANRFEGYKDDILLGQRKGRYVSVKDYFKEVGFTKGSTEVLKRAIRSLTLGTTFKNTDFNNFAENTNLKEIDLANMRKVVTELGMYVTLYTSYLILKAFKDGLNDDDEKKFALNLLINQGLRLETDILFYLNPSEFKNLLRDLVPATSIITDTMQFLDAGGKMIKGEDTINSGVYSGNSRFLREFSQMLPFGTQFYKTYNYGIQSFDK